MIKTESELWLGHFSDLRRRRNLLRKQERFYIKMTLVFFSLFLTGCSLFFYFWFNGYVG